ncbi:MAG: ornithine cyclodeaminase family protein [Peptoniphilaceae bacterium]
MKIRILNEKEMESVMTMEDAIQADKNALELYSRGKSIVPLRVNIDAKEYEGQNLYMPGLVGDAAGLKIVSVYPNNISKGLTSVPASMILLDEKTGQVASLMDGTYLTRLRTGAVAGAGTDLLARKDSSVFALFGTGGQARYQLEAVLTIRTINQVYVYDIDQDRAKQFAEEMTVLYGEKFNVKINSVSNPKEAVENADIITSVTTSKKPVFDFKDVKKGSHINGVGSYTPDMQEIPGELFKEASKIYLDTREGVLNESGDLINPLKEGIITESDITGELGDLIAGKTIGREAEDEITIFETTGTAVLDLLVAKAIYKKAAEKDIGQLIEL